MAIDPLIVSSWIEAAADLGIRVVAPFEFEASDGRRVLFEVFVVDFGSRTGAIIMSESSRDDEAVKGKWSSVCSEGYRTYDRQYFLETLDDWGWYGDKAKTPPWYTGKPWTSP